MTIPDETLMAYADGKLEPAQRAEVEAAMAADPKLAARLQRHRVPGRAATVTDLRRVRAVRAAEAKEAAASARRAELARRPWTWFEWGAMAASVAAGAAIAHLALKSPEVNRIGMQDGRLLAQTDLSAALSTQLASDQSADMPLQIGASFKSRSGDICRTFTVKEANVLGGLACREGDEWRIRVLANAPAGVHGDGTGDKPLGGMPAAVRSAVEHQIQGEPLDAAGEAAARARGWK